MSFLVNPYAHGGADPLVFHAFDDVAGTFSADVIVGTGSVTESRSSTNYAWDGTKYASYGSGVPIEEYANSKWWVRAEPARTNSQIWSSDLTNAEWTASNMTVAKDAVGLTGAANGACTLTATAGNATVIANAITASSGTHSTRWFLKRKTGTGTVELTLDNGSTWNDITTDLDAASGWYSEPVAQAALTNPQIGIRIVTSGDAVEVGNAECHTATTVAACRGASPLFTTTAAVSTVATALSFDDANHSDTQGAWYAEVKTIGYGTWCLAGLGNSGQFIRNNTTNTWSSGDGTSGVNGPSVSLAADDTEYKVAIAYGSSSRRVNTGNSWGAAGVYDGSFNNALSKIAICNSTNPAVATPAPILIRNIRRYDEDYTTAQATIDGLMA